MRTDHLCVAIAEDEDEQRLALERLLIAEGFDVLSFEDGDELFDYFQQTGVRQADVIVADLNMPGRSGLEGLQLARARGLTAPIFVVTGEQSPDLHERVGHLSNALLFRKPIDPVRFTQALHYLVGLSGA